MDITQAPSVVPACPPSVGSGLARASPITWTVLKVIRTDFRVGDAYRSQPFRFREKIKLDRLPTLPILLNKASGRRVHSANLVIDREARMGYD